MRFAPDVALAVQANRAVSQALGQQIEALEKRLKERVSLRPEYRLLKTVPGIGETLATTIMLETGRSVALPRSATSVPTAAASTACGRVTARRRAKATPGTATSTWPGRLWRQPTSRCATARRPRASTIARSARPTASWRSRRLAHKLARACYHILREQKPFDVHAVFRVTVGPGGEPGKRTGVKLPE